MKLPIYLTTEEFNSVCPEKLKKMFPRCIAIYDCAFLKDGRVTTPPRVITSSSIKNPLSTIILSPGFMRSAAPLLRKISGSEIPLGYNLEHKQTDWKNILCIGFGFDTAFQRKF
jgi:hypothetical protein